MHTVGNQTLRIPSGETKARNASGRRIQRKRKRFIKQIEEFMSQSTLSTESWRLWGYALSHIFFSQWSHWNIYIYIYYNYLLCLLYPSIIMIKPQLLMVTLLANGYGWKQLLLNNRRIGLIIASWLLLRSLNFNSKMHVSLSVYNQYCTLTNDCAVFPSLVHHSRP